MLLRYCMAVTSTRLPFLFAIAVVLALSPTASMVAQAPATLSDPEAIERFLREAKVLKTRAAGKGITGSTRATLSDGTLTHDAQIQSVDEARSEFRTNKGVEFNFRDSWTYNVAAYRVARLIGLTMVPVSIERTWASKPSAFTWWVDDVAMDEEKRSKENIQPPRTDCWIEQMHQIRMFDALIDNTDRNLGNILYTKDWRIWAIDHTRAFRRSPAPESFKALTRIDRGTLAKLEALDFAALKKAIGAYLPDHEIRLLLSRRDALVKNYTSRGPAALFDSRDYSAGCAA